MKRRGFLKALGALFTAPLASCPTQAPAQPVAVSRLVYDKATRTINHAPEGRWHTADGSAWGAQW